MVWIKFMRRRKSLGFACFFIAVGMLFMLFIDSKVWGMLAISVLLIVGYFCMSCE